MGEGGKLREYKESSSWIWGEAKYRSEMIRKVRYSRRKKL